MYLTNMLCSLFISSTFIFNRFKKIADCRDWFLNLLKIKINTKMIQSEWNVLYANTRQIYSYTPIHNAIHTDIMPITHQLISFNVVQWATAQLIFFARYARTLHFHHQNPEFLSISMKSVSNVQRQYK